MIVVTFTAFILFAVSSVLLGQKAHAAFTLEPAPGLPNPPQIPTGFINELSTCDENVPVRSPAYADWGARQTNGTDVTVQVNRNDSYFDFAYYIGSAICSSRSDVRESRSRVDGATIFPSGTLEITNGDNIMQLSYPNPRDLGYYTQDQINYRFKPDSGSFSNNNYIFNFRTKKINQFSGGLQRCVGGQEQVVTNWNYDACDDVIIPVAFQIFFLDDPSDCTIITTRLSRNTYNFRIDAQTQTTALTGYGWDLDVNDGIIDDDTMHPPNAVDASFYTRTRSYSSSTSMTAWIYTSASGSNPIRCGTAVIDVANEDPLICRGGSGVLFFDQSGNRINQGDLSAGTPFRVGLDLRNPNGQNVPMSTVNYVISGTSGSLNTSAIYSPPSPLAIISNDNDDTAEYISAASRPIIVNSFGNFTVTWTATSSFPNTTTCSTNLTLPFTDPECFVNGASIGINERFSPSIRIVNNNSVGLTVTSSSFSIDGQSGTFGTPAVPQSSNQSYESTTEITIANYGQYIMSANIQWSAPGRSGNITCDDTARTLVASQPYFRVFGGDVSVGDNSQWCNEKEDERSTAAASDIARLDMEIEEGCSPAAYFLDPSGDGEAGIAGYGTYSVGGISRDTYVGAAAELAALAGGRIEVLPGSQTTRAGIGYQLQDFSYNNDENITPANHQFGGAYDGIRSQIDAIFDPTSEQTLTETLPGYPDDFESINLYTYNDPTISPPNWLTLDSFSNNGFTIDLSLLPSGNYFIERPPPADATTTRLILNTGSNGIGNDPSGNAKRIEIYAAQSDVFLTTIDPAISKFGYTDYSYNGNVNNIPYLHIVNHGDIYIHPDVAEVDGYYISEHRNSGSGSNTYTCWSPPRRATENYPNINSSVRDNLISIIKDDIAACSQRQLRVNGAILSSHMHLYRNVGTLYDGSPREQSSSSNIAEIFQFIPELFLITQSDVTAADSERSTPDAFYSLPPVF